MMIRALLTFVVLIVRSAIAYSEVEGTRVSYQQDAHANFEW